MLRRKNNLLKQTRDEAFHNLISTISTIDAAVANLGTIADAIIKGLCFL